MNSRLRAGFTLVEISVALAAFGLIMFVAFGMIGGLSRALTKNNQMARAQADARVALDMLEADLRSAGAEIDYAAGQRRFVFASPYNVAFNANLFPVVDDGSGFPGAINAGAAGSGVPSDGNPFYQPQTTFATGAETVVLTIDSNADGNLDGTDFGDDLDEDSANPRDLVLYRSIYGWDGSANVADRRPIALIRGPGQNDDGEHPQPLFAYWIDHDDDRATASLLFGDDNGNGSLDQGEIAALTPVLGSDLSRIERVHVTVTTESVSPDAKTRSNDGYLRHALSADVQMRQRPSTTAVVYGRVWRDLDADGLFTQGEPPIADALVRSSVGFSTKSRGDGLYRLDVAPGQQTITEVDPTGYVSTTPNDVAVDLHPGDYRELNFGDNVGSGMGIVNGVVFDDLNSSSTRESDEPGLPGVKIYSDGGEYTMTGSDGTYTLDVPLGNRTISEFDPDGYLSTTPNAVDVVLDTPAQTVTVNFGDASADETGTVRGWVFLDENRNGVRDSREPGVLGARIVVSGQSADSDGQGFFSMTVPVGTHSVTEADPPGYTSTTPNTLHGVRVDVDQTVTVFFGDIVEDDVDFDVIELADTERALSIAAGDVKEDTRGDAELMLGTRFAGGINNLLIWENQRRNSSTPNGAIFESTPTYTRANLADVTALTAIDLDRDGDVDLVSGLSETIAPMLNVWMAAAGSYPTAPSQLLATAGGVGILDFATGDLDNDGDIDVVAGLRDGDLVGHVEIWWNNGSGGLSRSVAGVIRTGASASPASLGEATAVAVADLDRDGWLDLIVGSVESNSTSGVHSYLRNPGDASDPFKPYQKFTVVGRVNDIAALDMVEDDQGDIDLLIATEHDLARGGIEQWNTAEDGYFGLRNEGSRSMEDWMPTDGAPINLVTGYVDNDIFPDVIVGTRASDVYFSGHVQLARTFGYLPSEGRLLEENAIGVVMTMTGKDFNLDNVLDFAVGTQESSSRGKVYVFYRR